MATFTFPTHKNLRNWRSKCMSHNFKSLLNFRKRIYCVQAPERNYLHQLNQQQSASLKEMNTKYETAITQGVF